MAAKRVLCLKLVSGEEIIGDVSREGASDVYIVDNPIYIQLNPQANGKMQLNMNVPFLMYAKSRKFNIPLQSVVVDFEPTEDLRNEYSKVHGTGIVTASGSVIDPKTLLLS